MAIPPNRPADPHPSVEEHYDKERHPGGAHSPDQQHAGISVHAHDGSARRADAGAARRPMVSATTETGKSKASGVSAVVWVFVLVLIAVLIALWVTLSGVLPGDDGAEPSRQETPTVLPGASP
jgi:cobalamin biosynthesis Mg chelatase CobN